MSFVSGDKMSGITCDWWILWGLGTFETGTSSEEQLGADGPKWMANAFPLVGNMAVR